MVYDITTLVGWARRSGGDIIRREFDTIVADGSNRRFTINNEGYINVLKVEEDLTEITTGYSVEDNRITFNQVPAAGTRYDITYENATYSDEQILDFLVDAVRKIGGDLAIRWTVEPQDYELTDTGDGKGLYNAENQIDPRVEKLFALRAAVNIIAAKNQIAAGDAILIEDGETTIDTSKTAQNVAAVLKAIATEYKDELKTVKSERFRGNVLNR